MTQSKRIVFLVSSASMVFDGQRSAMGHFDVPANALNIIIGLSARVCHFIGYF